MKREPIVFGTHPGPQSEFCATNADICVFGGGVSGGKTIGGLLDLVRWSGTKNFYGLVVRRVGKNLQGPGSIWEKSKRIFGASGGRYREGSFLDWQWKSGAYVKFDHCQHEADVERKYQGQEYDVVLMEELTHFTEYQFWYLWGRLRSGSGSGIKPYLRATCNPDPDSFVRKLIDWWIDPETGYAIPERSGQLRWFVRDGDKIVWGDSPEEVAKACKVELHEVKSLTFIRSSIEDNPTMIANDPDYRSKLKALPLVERERLLGGNWNIRWGAGTFFQEEWFEPADAKPAYFRGKVRGWDFASTKPHDKNKDPDWTRGILMSRTHDGLTYIEDRKSTRDGPVQVEELVMQTAREDGKGTVIAFYQDPGQAGAFQAEKMALALQKEGFTVDFVRASSSKIDFARPFAKALKERKVRLVGAEWGKEYKSYHHKFPSKDVKDDDIDASARAYNTLDKFWPHIENVQPLKQPDTVWGRPRVNYGR